MIDEPYFLEIGDHGCQKCSSGETWDIIGPDGAAQGTSWGDKEEAENICEMLNEAWGRGFDAGSHPGLRREANRKSGGQGMSEYTPPPPSEKRWIERYIKASEERKNLKALNTELLAALEACQMAMSQNVHPMNPAWKLSESAISKAKGKE